MSLSSPLITPCLWFDNEGEEAAKSHEPLSDTKSPLKRLLQPRNIHLNHFHHRLHRPLRALFILTTEPLLQLDRHDLPAEPELVLQPPTLALGPAALEQLAPVVVYLGLVLAVDLERDGFGELELRPAVQSHEGSVGDFEVDGEDFACELAVGFVAGLGGAWC